MKFVSLLVLLTTTTLMAQSPLVETLAYSRSTTSGIPGSDNSASLNNALPASYFIYIVVKKGTPVSLAGVCLNGQSYSATLKKVRSPVLVEHDVNVRTGQKDTLVKTTSDDVYQIRIGPQTGPGCKDEARALAQNNQAVVCLTSGGSLWYGLAKTIFPLQPAAAM